MHALVLFSHGSLLCGAGEAVDIHAERLRQQGKYDRVAVGYLNYSEPLFAETVAALVAEGVDRITVLPYFLISGYFVRTSLPETLEPVRAAFPTVEFSVAPAIGFHETLAEALFDSAIHARTEERWRDPLKRAARACRPSPDCPLYGTPGCPKVPSLPAREENLHV
ncbi:MAG: CbiX/SirB N-terminal domain-containing protein [Capsulimonadales bacterium]|nr:CbiX/SirB N-terminal domain-containing protein [Capsulimonadales bacterium]